MGEQSPGRLAFTSFDRALRAKGYEPRAPSAEIAAQDEATCRRLACEHCRRPGLTYRPYVRPAPGPATFGYRALAVCRRCDEAIEF